MPDSFWWHNSILQTSAANCGERPFQDLPAPPGTAFSYHDRYCFDLRAFRYGCRTDTPFGCLFLWHRRSISGTALLSREWCGFCLSCGFPLFLCAMPPQSERKAHWPGFRWCKWQASHDTGGCPFSFWQRLTSGGIPLRSNLGCHPQIPYAGFSKTSPCRPPAPGSPDRNEWRTAWHLRCGHGGSVAVALDIPAPLLL